MTLVFFVALVLAMCGSSGEAVSEGGGGRSLDLENPIDVSPSGSGPPPPSRDSKALVSASSIVLFDDRRDELRHQERRESDKIRKGLQEERDERRVGGERREERNVGWWNGDTGTNARDRDPQRERVRDRLNWLQYKDTGDGLYGNRYDNRRMPLPSSSSSVTDWGSGDRGRPTPLQDPRNPQDETIKAQIARGRDEEIRREVEKALVTKERLLKEMAHEKASRVGGFNESRDRARPLRPRSKYEETELERRERIRRAELGRWRERGGSLGSDADRRRVLNRREVFGEERRGFDSSLERREYERRKRLSQGNLRLEKQLDQAVPLPSRRLLSERSRGNSLEKQREEERFRELERRRKNEILNEDRQGELAVSFEVNRGQSLHHHHHDNSKPPIIIYEQVPVPVADNYLPDRPSVIQSHQLHISDLYDERAPDRDNHYPDRRPGRPDIGPHEVVEDVIHVEEGVLLPNVPPYLPIPVSIPIGGNVPRHLLGHAVINPAIEANIAAANGLERLKHVAALANLNRFNQLRQAATLNKLGQAAQASAIANAAIKNQAAAHAVNNRAAVAHAAKNQAVAEAVNQQLAGTVNKHQQALISQSLLNDQLLSTALTEDQISKSQKIDFMKLVVKHGLRNALREQLRFHLKNRAQGEEYIHRLEATKEDLIRRLLMLKPYFKSPGHEGFILPAFVPNIPEGAHMSKIQINSLPKLQLLPSTTLLAPDFRLPNEVSIGLQKEIDIAFVEHTLRLPEIVFEKVFHLPKREFILALFPRLYRETVAEMQYQPEVHYHPNLPHVSQGPSEEHHHHHVHVHDPNNHKQDAHTHHTHDHTQHTHEYTQTSHKDHLHNTHNEPHSSQGKYSPISHAYDTHQHSSHGIFPPSPHSHDHTHPPILITHSHPHSHDQSGHDEQSQVVFQDHAQREVILPTSNHKLKPQGAFHIGYGAPLPLEKSSYVSYDPPPVGARPFQGGHQNKFAPKPIKFTPSSYRPTPAPFYPSPLHVIGINVKPKGEEGHTLPSTTTTSISSSVHSDHPLFFPPSLKSRNRRPIPAQSDSHFKFNLSPVQKHTATHAISQLSSSKAIDPLPSSSTEAHTFHTSRFSTLKPRPVTTYSTPKPPTTISSSIFTTFRPTETNFPTSQYITTPFPTTTRPITTFFTSSRPSTTTFFPTSRPITTNTFIPTLTSIGGSFDDERGLITFLTSTQPSVVDASPNPALTPFQVFNGNAPPTSPTERPIEAVPPPGSDLDRVPGTDKHDDDHVISFFQKKKGNATGDEAKDSKENQGDIFSPGSSNISDSGLSLVDQIRKITNIFGGTLQENVPDIRLERSRSNFTTPSFSSFFPDYPDYIDDSIPPTNTVQPAQTTFTSPSAMERLLPVINEQEGRRGQNNLESPNTLSRLAIDTGRKIPMPKRVQSFESFSRGGQLPVNHQGFPFQGPSANVARSGVSLPFQTEGRDPKSFVSIPRRELDSLPSFLREPPKCSHAGSARKSFCLYPEGYESNIASAIITKYEDDIKRIEAILAQIPTPKLDLQEAAKQIPTLDLSMSCEPVEKEVKLSWSRDVLGSWFSILQTSPFDQTLTVTTCGNAARLNGCRPLLQPRPLIAFHPDDVTRKPYVMEFPLPVGCVYSQPLSTPNSLDSQLSL